MKPNEKKAPAPYNTHTAAGAQEYHATISRSYQHCVVTVATLWSTTIRAYPMGPRAGRKVITAFVSSIET